MDHAYRPGNLNCSETSEMLSDLIDARLGELPHPDGTRLSEPGMRAALELHVAACAACREELRVLEDVGAAYREYSVNEAPAQSFADFGAKVRARMARQTTTTGALKVTRPSRFRPLMKRIFHPRWTMTVAAGLAAAALAVAVLRQPTPPRNRPYLATAPMRILNPKDLNGMYALQIQRPDGAQLVSQDFVINPTAQHEVRKLENDEGRLRFLVFGERAIPGAQLFGAYLKTTRDEDRVVDQGPGGLMIYKVEPGSVAASLDLQANDHIVTINDMPVDSGGAQDAINFLSGLQQLGKGTPITLHVVRPGRFGYMFMKPLHGVLGQPEASVRVQNAEKAEQ